MIIRWIWLWTNQRVPRCEGSTGAFFATR
jgi:hypothetical protein